MKDQIILVDSDDQEIGVMDKLQAHQLGLLHRAISVFIFNKNNELLLQRRAISKYHSPGLWTNTACSHPFPGETTFNAAKRRLKQEMGIEADLKYCFKFTYRVDFSNHLTEHEVDHVFVGFYDEIPNPDSVEVEEWRWINKRDLSRELKENPDSYTEWFKLCYEEAFNFATIPEELN